jgi:hypothetical protein
MPAAIPILAGEAALAVGAEAAAIAAAEAAALQAAQVAAAEAAAQAAAAAAAETAATTAATNLATNQSILGAIGAGGGAPASTALGGAGSGLGATSAYTGALTGSPAAYGMPPTPAGLEQIANPALTAPPPAYGMPPSTESLLPGNAPGFNQMSQAELAQLQANIPQAGSGVQVAGPMDAVNPEMLNQVAPEATNAAYDLTTTGSNIPNPAYEIRPSSVTEGLRMGPAEGIKTTMTELPKPAPSTLENAFTKAMDWVKDNKMTTLSLGMNAGKLFGKGSGGGDEKKEYDGVLTKYKMSPDFQGRQADPEDYQYTPKVYAEGGIMQAYAEGGITGQGNLDLNIPLNIGGGGGGYGGGGGGNGGGAGYSGGYEPSNTGFGGGMLAPAVQPRGQFAGTNNTGLGGMENGIAGLFGNLGGMAQTPSYENYVAGRGPLQQDLQMTREQMGGMVGGVENNYRGVPGLVNAAARTPSMFKEGGSVASYRDGGKAAMDYYERMTKPKQASTPDKTDVGIFFDTDPDTRSLDALTAAQVRMAKVNKRANMQLPGMKRPTPMGRINLAPPGAKSPDGDVTEAAQGGIMGLGGYAAGGNPRLLKGPGDGMSDNIPATIAGKQPARLADGEFVIPADVVSHLGNGSTEAGAKKLHRMMTQVRKARTGNPKQGKQINPNKYMPK